MSRLILSLLNPFKKNMKSNGNRREYLTYFIIVSAFIFWNCSSSPRYTSKTVIRGISSYYGHNDGFHGKRTANGEIFDKNAMTAAHKTLPLNTIIIVTNIDRWDRPSARLKINDRGPFVKGRILDCSVAAAKKLGFFQKGTAKVKIEVVRWGDNKYYKH